MQRAAAGRRPRRHDLETSDHHEAHGLAVGVREHRLHDARLVQGDASSRHPGRRKRDAVGILAHARAVRQRLRDPRERTFRARCELGRGRHAAARPAGQPAAARAAQPRAKGAALAQPQQVRDGVHAFAVGQHGGQHPARERACGRRATDALFDLAARGLEHAAVRHARGAHGLARPAVEAAVEVADQRVVGRDAAVGEAAHEPDAAARRVRLELERAISRARGEAQATVDAGVQVASRGRIRAHEPRASCAPGSFGHAPASPSDSR